MHRRWAQDNRQSAASATHRAHDPMMYDLHPLRVRRLDKCQTLSSDYIQEKRGVMLWRCLPHPSREPASSSAKSGTPASKPAQSSSVNLRRWLVCPPYRDVLFSIHEAGRRLSRIEMRETLRPQSSATAQCAQNACLADLCGWWSNDPRSRLGASCSSRLALRLAVVSDQCIDATAFRLS